MSLNNDEKVKSIVTFIQGASLRKASKISVEKEGVRSPVLNVRYEDLGREVFNRAYWVVKDGYLRSDCQAEYKAGDSASSYSIFKAEREVSITKGGRLVFRPEIKSLARGATFLNPITLTIPTGNILTHGLTEEPYVWLMRYEIRGEDATIDFDATLYSRTNGDTISTSETLVANDLITASLFKGSQIFPKEGSRQGISSTFKNETTSTKEVTSLFEIYDLCLVPEELITQARQALKNR